MWRENSTSLVRFPPSTEAPRPTEEICVSWARNKSCGYVSCPTSIISYSPAEYLALFRLIDLCSETLGSSPCWASRVPSWPAGRFYFRNHAHPLVYGIGPRLLLTNVSQALHIRPDRRRDCSPFLGLYRDRTGNAVGLRKYCGNGVYVRSIISFILVELLITVPFRSPTAGGQYHWVSEFAPPKIQKLLSYIVGR
jgi:hypothetical protein